MTAAFELRFKKDFQALLGDFLSDDPGAKCQHICIIVLTGEARRSAVVTKCCTHGPMPVRRDRDADSRTADQNTPFCAAAGDCLRHCVGEVRIINRFAASRSEIEKFVTLGAQVIGEKLF